MVSVTNGVSWAAARVGGRAPIALTLALSRKRERGFAARHFSASPLAGAGFSRDAFHLSRLRERSPATRVREHWERDSRGGEPNIAAMLQRALRGEGRLAYCSSPAASELAPSFRRLRVKIPSAPTRCSPEVSCRSPPLSRSNTCNISTPTA